MEVNNPQPPIQPINKGGLGSTEQALPYRKHDGIFRIDRFPTQNQHHDLSDKTFQTHDKTDRAINKHIGESWALWHTSAVSSYPHNTSKLALIG